MVSPEVSAIGHDAFLRPRHPERAANDALSAMLDPSGTPISVRFDSETFVANQPIDNAYDVLLHILERLGLVPPDVDPVAEGMEARRAIIETLTESYSNNLDFIAAAPGTEGLRQVAQEVADRTKHLDTHPAIIALQQIRRTLLENREKPQGSKVLAINGAMRLMRVAAIDALNADRRVKHA